MKLNILQRLTREQIGPPSMSQVLNEIAFSASGFNAYLMEQRTLRHHYLRSPKIMLHSNYTKFLVFEERSFGRFRQTDKELSLIITGSLIKYQ